MGYKKLKNIIWLSLTFYIAIVMFILYKYMFWFSNKNLIYVFTLLTLSISLIIFFLTTYFFKRIKILEKEIRLKDSLLTNELKSNEIENLVDNLSYQWSYYLSSLNETMEKIQQTEVSNQLDTDATNMIELGLNNINCQKQTIKDFRSFYGLEIKKEKFTLKHIIDLSIKLITSNLKKNKVEIDLNIRNVEIFGLKNKLSKVIVNILNNANDVFYEKNLKKENDNYLKILVEKDLSYVTIIVHDNAGGIPDQFLDKVFEKYFTTKENKRGIGEGLFIAKKILTEDFNGTIHVRNEGLFYKDKKYLGAKFTIKLPIS